MMYVVALTLFPSVCSVKWVGLFVIALVGMTTIKDLWDLLGDLSITMVSDAPYPTGCTWLSPSSKKGVSTSNGLNLIGASLSEPQYFV